MFNWRKMWSAIINNDSLLNFVSHSAHNGVHILRSGLSIRWQCFLLLNLTVNITMTTWNLGHVPMHGGMIELMVWIHVMWAPLYGKLDFCKKLLLICNLTDVWKLSKPNGDCCNEWIYIGKHGWAHLFFVLDIHKGDQIGNGFVKPTWAHGVVNLI